MMPACMLQVLRTIVPLPVVFSVELPLLASSRSRCRRPVSQQPAGL